MLEDKFLENLIKKIEPLKNGEIGIGDDSAFLFVPQGSILITQDSFSEKVHFPSNFPLKLSVKRGLRASLSDINAMGGRGKYVILTLGIRKENSKEMGKILKSLEDECKIFNLKIAGGDTISSPFNFFTFTITGILPLGKKPLLRSEAKPGDFIYLSGPLGKMGIALKLIKGNKVNLSKKKKREFIDYFLKPEIPYPLGEELLLSGKVKCAIDVSDGLSIDLHRLCRRSGTGAIIYSEKIPFIKEIDEIFLREEEKFNFLLSSGEEFQLLFTSPFDLDYPKIGKITEEKKIQLERKGKLKILKPLGYDHFK
ncbi:MAG: thiamine-phosphate kinase [Thermoanaerobaculia bacterium]